MCSPGPISSEPRTYTGEGVFFHVLIHNSYSYTMHSIEKKSLQGPSCSTFYFIWERIDTYYVLRSEYLLLTLLTTSCSHYV